MTSFSRSLLFLRKTHFNCLVIAEIQWISPGANIGVVVENGKVLGKINRQPDLA
ncbi:MAG: hypothetical protein NTW32_03640 [Chloroflexi bacterium]|nr:hypothetical protein [Chloroflexota bacterium]